MIKLISYPRMKRKRKTPIPYSEDEPWGWTAWHILDEEGKTLCTQGRWVANPHLGKIQEIPHLREVKGEADWVCWQCWRIYENKNKPPQKSQPAEKPQPEQTFQLTLWR